MRQHIFYDEVEVLLLPESQIRFFYDEDDTGFKSVITPKGKFYYSAHFTV